MYRFKFEVTEADYWEFNRFHVLTAMKTQKSHKVLRFLFWLLGLILMLLIFLQIYQGNVQALTVFFCVLMFLYAIFYTQTLLWTAKLNIRALKKQGKLPYEPQAELIFDEAAFTEITPEAEAKTKYSKLIRIEEGRNAVYLFTDVIRAELIPFSAFESDAQKQAFLAFIKSKMPAMTP